jgi:hypothetical protein
MCDTHYTTLSLISSAGFICVIFRLTLEESNTGRKTDFKAFSDCIMLERPYTLRKEKRFLTANLHDITFMKMFVKRK